LKRWPACTGYFHLAEKKGYSGVGVYTRLEPSDVTHRLTARASSTPRAATSSCALTRRTRKHSIISAYFPSGSSGEERQQAKFRFLDGVLSAPVSAASAERDFMLCGDINIAHQEIDLKNWKGNQQKLRLSARRARLDDPAATATAAWSTCTAS